MRDADRVADRLFVPGTPGPRAEVRALGECLSELTAFVRRFVVLAEPQGVAAALWIAHTWIYDRFDATPYLSIRSAEKRSGKTRLLECLELLVRSPWLTSRTSAAALVRKVEADAPTLLLDETDAAFSGEKEYSEALRGVLNAGHRRGGCASLCVRVGKEWEIHDFAVFCPKALAGIGRLPGTVADRSIRIELRRRTSGEAVERFRRRLVEGEARLLRDALEEWARGAGPGFGDHYPPVPEALSDRAADGWETLLAIADAAGGEWPGRSRAAAVALSGGPEDAEESLGERLLRDAREAFREAGDPNFLETGALLAALLRVEAAPWSEVQRGKPLSPHGLARRLAAYGVKPGKSWIDGRDARGYARSDFLDAWTRYTPERPPETPGPPVSEGNGARHFEGSRRFDSPENRREGGIRRDSCHREPGTSGGTGASPGGMNADAGRTPVESPFPSPAEPCPACARPGEGLLHYGCAPEVRP